MARIQAPKGTAMPRINLVALVSRVFGHQSRNFYWIFGTSLFIVVFTFLLALDSFRYVIRVE